MASPPVPEELYAGCPTCGAEAGRKCISLGGDGRQNTVHQSRIAASADAGVLPEPKSAAGKRAVRRR